MSTGSILLGLALFLGVAFFLAHPFLLPSRQPDTSRHATPAASSRQPLLAAKEVLLVRLRALDFDYETGKIPADIYESQRLTLKMETVGVLRQLDALTPATPPAAGLGDEIEAAVAARRGHAGRAASPTAVEGEIEAAVARRRHQGAPAKSAAPAQANGQPVARFCPRCGQRTDVGDKFCAGCGTPLAQPASETESSWKL